MLPDEDFEREHPSYGILHITRTHGGGGSIRLFGSPLATHYGTIRISVSAGRWIHGLNHDRYFGMNKDFIEIEMSAAQFADAITSLNIGSGTPCTIRYVQGERVEDPPNHLTEAEHIRENFNDTLGKYISKVKEYRKTIEHETTKLGEKARSKIRIALDVIEDQLAANIPFVLKQFQEATTRVTTAAKAEVEAFVTGAIRAAGLQAIADGRMPSLLPSGNEQRAMTREIVKAGVCPACLSLGECVSQCPSAGNVRCKIDHFQNCEALLCCDDTACNCGTDDV